MLTILESCQTDLETSEGLQDVLSLDLDGSNGTVFYPGCSEGFNPAGVHHPDLWPISGDISVLLADNLADDKVGNFSSEIEPMDATHLVDSPLQLIPLLRWDARAADYGIGERPRQLHVPTQTVTCCGCQSH